MMLIQSLEGLPVSLHWIMPTFNFSWLCDLLVLTNVSFVVSIVRVRKVKS